MNYRHIFHAGNFADVHKHVVLARIIAYLKRKDGAFRVIDTHAGAGMYDLASAEAAKTGEWLTGIARLSGAALPDGARELLAPYLEAVDLHRREGQLSAYPGSPLIIRNLLRRQDRLSAFELHPEDHSRLCELFEGDIQARITRLDGWLVPGAHLPPKERRGMVLIDPPFELDGEFDRMVEALASGQRRWPAGTFCLWYPLKHGGGADAFIDRLKKSGLPDLVCSELVVDPDSPGLRGSGLVVKNPPFVLESELDQIMPVLASLLGRSEKAGWRFERLTAE